MHTTPYSMVWFIENYNFKFLRSKFQPMMTSMIRISLSTTLNIYKTYFKSHQVQKQRSRTHILCVKLLGLYAFGFCNRMFLDLHRL